ncbi:MAG: hypothetical protein Q4F75_02325 [Pseudomonadota bacterium]|nr:hypothetical protein [Pseudomonadota bacterium]
MTKKYDTFDYEIKYITYENSYTSGSEFLRCVFIINGKDILDIVKETLIEFKGYHHTTLSDLLAFDLDDEPYEIGRIHPLICSCDELGCANITVSVTENNGGIIWNCFHQGDASDEENDVDTQDLGLSFEFESTDYKRKIAEIKSLALKKINVND